MSTRLTESRPLVLTEAMDADTGQFELQLITPGVGSCGAYPESTLTEAVKAGKWPKGLHLYLDHPTATEEAERPERSVRDLAGVLVEDATWNGSAVVAKAKVYSAYRPLLAEAAADIGMSIRAAGLLEAGEYDGKRASVVTSLDEVFSVDFVTRAGRGGAVLSVLESARVAASEASTDTTRELLNDAVQQAHGSEGKYIWIRDFDPDKQILWFNVTSDTDGSQTYEQGYSYDGSLLDLTGDATAVRQVTTYVPVANPAGQSNTTESLGETMPQIEEAEHRRLVEDAGRVPTLVSERDTAISERDTAIAERDTVARALAEANARTAAQPIVTAVLAESTTLPATVQARVAAEVLAAAPLTDAGALDEAALRTAAETARTSAETEIATVLEAHGVGKPRALGASSTSNTAISESAYDERSASVFGRTTVKGA